MSTIKLYVSGDVHDLWDWLLLPTDVSERIVAELIEGPAREEARLAIKHGGEWLAERRPYWAPMIVAAAEAEMFQMSCGGRCAVGTVVGEYGREFGEGKGGRYGFLPSRELVNEAAALLKAWDGYDEWFDTLDDESATNAKINLPTYVAYAALEQLWLDYAREQVS